MLISRVKYNENMVEQVSVLKQVAKSTVLKVQNKGPNSVDLCLLSQ